MSQPWIDPTPTPIAEEAPLTFSSLLAKLAVGADPRPSPDDVLSAAASFEGVRPWTDALVRACAELGVLATAFSGTVADAARAVGPDHPVVGHDGDDFVLLTDRRGGKLLVETARGKEPMRRGALSRLVDPLGKGTVEWVSVAAPIALTRSENGAPEIVRESAPPSPFARLQRLVHQERHDVAVVLVYAIGVGLLTLATPIAVQALVGAVAFGTLLQPLLVLALLLFAGLAFSAVLRGLSTWVVEILQRRFFFRMTKHLAESLPNVPLARFDRSHGPEILNRYFDVFTVQKTAASLLLGGLEIALTTLVGMLVLAFYHPLLLAFDAVLVAAMLVILFGLSRHGARTAILESKKKYALAAWFEEVVFRPTVFRLAGARELARTRADGLAIEYLDARASHFRIVFRQAIAALALHVIVSSCLLAIGGWLVIERQLTLGQLVAAELIVTAVVVSFAKAGKYLENAYDLVAAIDKLGQLVDLPSETHGRASIDEHHDGPVVAVDRVRVTRGGRVLVEDASLELERGEAIAISGDVAHASALAEVIAGLRKPDRGRATLFGQESADLGREAVARTVALVRGDEVIAGTLSENVAFGHLRTTHAVRDAIAVAQLDDVIASLPDGLATHVTSTGAPLARSEVARVAIARAIATRPSAVVLDGALDVVEAGDRARILEALVARGTAAIVVTEDPSLAQLCTRRFRVEHGSLVEE
jgi:ABC-type bacteriocin/lantibiotic exporter with double-glycine peptidase domain